jgi:arabinofuranosyltransferase
VDPRRTRIAALAVLLAVAAAALVAHSLVFDFVTDDAFISFVYARNLAQHGQLVFNLGEHPVEGYTNFLWTLVMAALLKLGMLPEVTSRVLGTAFGIGTFGTAAWLSRRAHGSDWSPWDALPALILAGIPGYACWSSGGLETQMFAFFVTLAAATYLEDRLDARAPRLRSGILFGVAALTRPEGVLLFAVTGMHYVISKINAKNFRISRAEILWIVAFSSLVVPHLLWRHWYYGYWLPNTFYIKSSGGAGTWTHGAHYLGRVVEQFHLWIAPAIVLAGVIVSRQRGARLVAGYATLMVTVFALYVASVGGDFMGLFRFVMPVIPMIAIATALGLRLVLAPLTQKQPLASAAIVALLLAGHAAHAAAVDKDALAGPQPRPSDNGIDTPGFLRWYTADRAAVGKWFGRYARPDDYAAVGGAGAQVYYSGMRSLDCYGLSDEYIAHVLPSHDSRPGHQKYATDEYILSKHPTIITSHNYMFGYAPKYVGPDAGYWMARGYHYVTVPIPYAKWGPYYSFLLRNDRSFGPLPRLADEQKDREP